MPDAPLALEARSVTKAFGPIVALNSVSFTLRRGEIHALVGRNGAGKSTLVKTPAGFVSPDQGEILVDGTPVTLTNARPAQAASITVVEQELSLEPALTVLENILLGRVGANFRSRTDDRRQVQGSLTRLDLNDAPPDTMVEDLSMAERQLLEIARAAATHASSSSTSRQRLSTSERLSASSPSSGNWPTREAASSSSRIGSARCWIYAQVTVLRDGRMIATEPAAEMSRQSIVELMLGKVAKRSKVERRDNKAREGPSSSTACRCLDMLRISNCAGARNRRHRGPSGFGRQRGPAGACGSDAGRTRPRVDRRPSTAPGPPSYRVDWIRPQAARSVGER
jgi:ABC-type iron transport system FetAB ATPase subunit